MNLTSFFQVLLIIILLLIVVSVAIVFLKIEEVKRNWPKYRCNPAIIPFASTFGQNTSENFIYCIQNMQTEYMGTLLQPLNFMNDIFIGSIGSLMKDIQDVKFSVNMFKFNFMGIFAGLLSIGGNLTNELTVMSHKINDTIKRNVAVIVILNNLVDTAAKTGQSTADGPVGDMVKFISKF